MLSWIWFVGTVLSSGWLAGLCPVMLLSRGWFPQGPVASGPVNLEQSGSYVLVWFFRCVFSFLFTLTMIVPSQLS